MLKPISPPVYLIEGENHGRFPKSHSILILDRVKALIDTGCGIERLKEIKRRYSINLIINSHTHPDHSSGNWIFSGHEIWSPIQSKDSAGKIDRLKKRLVDPEWLEEYWRDSIQKATGFRDAEVKHFYGEGYLFDFGDVNLRAIHTPGHLSDHYCFFWPEREMLFSFDIDFTSFGPWYGHRESEISQFKESIKKVQKLKPKIAVSSHLGLIQEDLDIRFQIYLETFEKREEQILDFLYQPRTMEDFIEEALIYKSYPYMSECLRYWEGQMVKKHLEELKKRRMVEVIQKDGRVFYKRMK